MPSRTRRALLKAVSLLAGGMAGCQTSSDGAPTEPSATTSTLTRSSTPPSTDNLTDTPTETPAPHPLRCGVGPRTDVDWPLAQRSTTHDSYVADGPTLDDSPSVSWSVKPAAPPDIDEQGAAFSQPIVTGNQLYVVNRVQYGPEVPDAGGHTLQARDRSTGELQWSNRFPQRPPSPAIRGEDVLVPSAGTLYALDREEGSERWTRTLDVYGRVVPTTDRIYAWGEKLYALAPDGTTMWARSFDNISVAQPPTVGSESVYVGLVGGTVLALDPATGETQWTAQTPRNDDETRALSPNISTIVATDCGVFVVTDGDIHAFDTAGKFVWHVEGYVFRLATDGTTLYSRDRDSDSFRTVLRAWDTATGELRWEQPFTVTSGAHGVLTDGALYVPTDDELLAIAPDDGRKLWGLAPSVRLLSFTGGTLFGTRLNEGALVALR